MSEAGIQTDRHNITDAMNAWIEEGYPDRAVAMFDAAFEHGDQAGPGPDAHLFAAILRARAEWGTSVVAN